MCPKIGFDKIQFGAIAYIKKKKKAHKNIFDIILGIMPEYCVYGHTDWETVFIPGRIAVLVVCHLCVAEVMKIAN